METQVKTEPGKKIDITQTEKIFPFLWFDNNAEEAVNFYTSIFKNCSIDNVSRYESEGAKASGMPEGSVMSIDFRLEGQHFAALNGGKWATFSPAISFFVTCESPYEIDYLWEKFSEGGKIMMEIKKYDFSERYGWIQDRFGVSWQLNLGDLKPKISPMLLFVGEKFGKATEAINHYTSIFKDSSIVRIERSGPNERQPEGAVIFSVFKISGQPFMAMESSLEHQFAFTPGISFFINCNTQEEVDYFWEKLSEGGQEMPCGWVQDKFGVTWQVVPVQLRQMLSDPDMAKVQQVMKAMVQMKKLDVNILKQAYQS